jgi:sulfatase modifying factor 1
MLAGRVVAASVESPTIRSGETWPAVGKGWQAAMSSGVKQATVLRDRKKTACCTPARTEALPSSAANDAIVASVTHGARSNAIPVAGGRALVGTDRPVIRADGEGPRRSLAIGDFALEAQTVTNRRFAEFVEATGYVSEAERFGWSAVFVGLLPDGAQRMNAAPGTPWWVRIDGAHWRTPEGPGSDIAGRMDHPVTQVSWADARAFAQWVGGRLPSEAEWEHAAGSADGRRFAWGDEEPDDDDSIFCNIWQGRFPDHNTGRDGYVGTAPAVSFEPTEAGFYNLCGNVWEWTADAFKVRSLSRMARTRNDRAQADSEKVLKGGSFLCHISYCYRYRIAARMSLTPDSAASNVGFRVAYDG